jgi:Cu(I)/Ag(I) efflux system membrane protein CusA/SilA
VTPAIFFSLLIIAVAFLPVFTLTGQAGRLFKPLAYTKTFVMLISALLSITFAPALRDLLIRGKIRSEQQHPVSRFIKRLYEPFVWVAMRKPKSTVAMGALALISAVPVGLRLGSEFMPPLNEGDILYMPITFPNISIEEAKRQLQIQDRILRQFPEVDTVFGKVGRAETATDAAPLLMVETTVRLKPAETWRTRFHHRWYSGWAPDWAKTALRPLWPEQRRITWDELTAEMNDRMHLPGWTNAWTMPIKTRIDMLTTGVRTPVGVKVFGTDLEEIEKVGTALEHLLTPIPGTRSVLYERNLGGLYVDIVPKPEALARHGLQVADIQRIIETAIGGTPIGVTIEGRNRFTINVRYPQEVRNDVEKLRRLLVPIPAAGARGGGAGMPMGTQGALWPPTGSTGIMLAQAMPGMEPGRGTSPGLGGPRPRLPGASGGPLSDVPMDYGGGMNGGAMPGRMPGGPSMAPMPPPPFPLPRPGAAPAAFVPLGQVADIRVTGGPPMVRDEAGLLVGYVYVDIDQRQRDIGGYVDEAKQVVNDALAGGQLTLPQGSYLKWTGQYEQLAEMVARMKVVVPLTLGLIVLLLFLQFRNFVEVLIVLLSLPFALVGSVWLLWLLDYRLSTAVWVGIIALVGLAAQTGIVMIVYIDNAYQRRKREGRINDLSDIVAAHMEGTVQRVRPKLMTVSTMLIGLVPLLWSTTSGADVMKRIAAPMVGGLITSAFLTLEIIPVVSTYWRQEQLLWDRLEERGSPLLRALRSARALLALGAALAAAALLSRLYVTLPGPTFPLVVVLSVLLFTVGCLLYFVRRPAARALVWPAREAP